MYVKIPVRVCRYANARDCKMKIDCVKPYSGSVYTLLVACVFRRTDVRCGGDTTQNVLLRLAHGEMDGYRTRGVALMIGTNNGESAEEIAEGIKAVVHKILEKQPEAKVVLMPIFPAEHSPSAPEPTLEPGGDAPVS